MAIPSSIICQRQRQRGSIITASIIGAVIIITIIIALITILNMNPRNDKMRKERIHGARNIPEKLLTWQEVSPFDLQIDKPIALTTSDNKIYIAGNGMIGVYEEDGKLIASIPTIAQAVAIDISDEGLLYIAHSNGVIVMSPDGKTILTFDAPDDRSVFVSIAVMASHIFVADYGKKSVLVYDLDGKLLREIDGKIDAQGGFNLPSAYFEVAAGYDGLIRIIDTGATGSGAKRITAYNVDGERMFAWGNEGQDIASFAGCCNPIAIAFLPNGEIVTAEKTLPTIKTFYPDNDGSLASVVAIPEQFRFAITKDIAVDSQGRILALIPKDRQVRIFQRKAAGVK